MPLFPVQNEAISGESVRMDNEVPPFRHGYLNLRPTINLKTVPP
jgi:hypothetical protein